MSRLAWYWARICAMSPGEIAHRTSEAAKKAVWHRDLRGWSHFRDLFDGPIIDLTFLRDRLRQSALSDAKPIIANGAGRARSGELEFFGQIWPLTNPDAWCEGLPDDSLWRLDPVTGKHWPGSDAYCFAIDFRNPCNQLGDVKHVWELNRLQFLHPIAATIAVAGDATLTRWAFRILASWARANPPFRGVNWASGIELALRIVSLALLVAAARPDSLEKEERELFRRLIAVHGYWLYRFPSRFSSANNHLVAEALGLFVAGTLVPDLENAEEWVRHARSVLEAEALKQILEDGVGVEQSPTYQAFTMEMIAFAALVAEGICNPLSSSVIDRLVVGATHLNWLLDRQGRAPGIGDNDEGRVIAQPPDREPRYVASIARAIAGLARRVDLDLPEHDPHIRDSLFASPAAVRPQPEGMRIFPAGGYTAIRDQIHKRQFHLVFDHGPLGYLSIAAHGHADALAIWLTLDDLPVFVDAGTYLYHAGRAMRGHLRSTKVHNTLVVADQSQSRIAGPFMWDRKAVARLIRSSTWPNWSVTGDHDGYERPFGVLHCRTLKRDHDGILIFDHLDHAQQELPVSLHFLCHPRLTLLIDSGGILIARQGEVLLKLVPPRGFQAKIVEGEQENGLGWYSARFGEIIPAPLVVLSGELGSRDIVTSLVIVPQRTSPS